MGGMEGGLWGRRGYRGELVLSPKDGGSSWGGFVPSSWGYWFQSPHGSGSQLAEVLGLLSPGSGGKKLWAKFGPTCAEHKKNLATPGVFPRAPTR